MGFLCVCVYIYKNIILFFPFSDMHALGVDIKRNAVVSL